MDVAEVILANAMTVKILIGDIGGEWRTKLREIVDNADDLEIIGETEQPISLLLEASNPDADVVVLAQTPQGEEPGVCSHLLLEYPNLAVVLVPSVGGATVCRMVLRREVRDASKEALQAMLRNFERG